MYLSLSLKKAMAEGSPDISVANGRVTKDSAQLAAVLKEMKDGLDLVRNKVQLLTAKVKDNQLPTANGISYLESKYLLLLSYCQSLVYYSLRKAKGLSIEGHPVVQNLIEIRLFLEKIRPIDKTMEYQIRKLTKDPGSVVEKEDAGQTTQKSEDLLKYRPNPDMLEQKQVNQDGDAVYRPPKFAPTAMEDEKLSKEEKAARRREKEVLRRTKESDFMKNIINDIEDKPEEIRDTVGTETSEVRRYVANQEKKARQEEEFFTRSLPTKKEKMRERHLKKMKSGLGDLAGGFFDEVKTLPMEDEDSLHIPGFSNHASGRKRFNKNKRKR